jgi:preprotein translocase subunit SecA
MLDDARAPLMIARDADQSQQRLMYEQAMELARALQPGRDFELEAGELRLTDAAAGLLDRLVTPLGGLWAARERREQLVALALHVLHVMQRDVDYSVQRDMIVLPERAREDAEGAAADDGVLLMLLEVKEGCRTSQRREVVARLAVPAFLSRYLHLGGICADARRVEGELWRFYGLRTALAGRRAAIPVARATVFAATADKYAALVRRAHATAPQVMLIALRTPAAAQALEKALVASGLAAATARGRGRGARPPGARGARPAWRRGARAIPRAGPSRVGPTRRRCSSSWRSCTMPSATSPPGGGIGCVERRERAGARG